MSNSFTERALPAVPGARRDIRARPGAGIVERVGRGQLPTVTFIIPVLNDADGLRRCLASIRANDYPRHLVEIIVGDNGSSDGSVDVARDAGATVLALSGLSVAAMRNRLAATASGQVLALVDADHELSPGWLRAAVNALTQPEVGAAGAAYHPPGNPTWVQSFYDGFRTHPDGPTETRWLGSGNLALWTEVFRGAGGFDTSLTACEDVDLCQRLRRRGHRLVADERLHSIHHGDPRTVRQLFASELWRGRDNLTVSLRGPLTLREIPSLAIPMIVLAAILVLPVATGAAALGLVAPLAIALGLILMATAARGLALVRRRAAYTPLGVCQALTVAGAYDLARALALVTRKSHRRA